MFPMMTKTSPIYKTKEEDELTRNGKRNMLYC